MGYLTELSRQKLVLNFFIVKLKSFLILCFLYDLFINKVKKLEVAMSNPFMEDIHVSLSLSLSLSLFWLGFIPFSFSFTFYLSLSLSLSLSLFVYAALQLLLCSVMSSSLILIINEL